MKKNKKKSQAESANKKRILLKLQKSDSYSSSTSKSLKELGLTDKKKFDRHLELLESEGLIKKSGSPENYRYWLSEKMNKSTEKKGSTNFLIIWFVSTFVLLFIFVLVFDG